MATTYYPLGDLLHRTAALTDDSGNIKEAYDTDAYGNTQMYSGPGTDGDWFTDDDVSTLQPTCEYIFQGRQYDPESQIYFYRARYYQPQLGRFISRDPINYLGGINFYEAFGGNPSCQYDPAGTATLQQDITILKQEALWFAGQGYFFAADLLTRFIFHQGPTPYEGTVAEANEIKNDGQYRGAALLYFKNLAITKCSGQPKTIPISNAQAFDVRFDSGDLFYALYGAHFGYQGKLICKCAPHKWDSGWEVDVRMTQTDLFDFPPGVLRQQFAAYQAAYELEHVYGYQSFVDTQTWDDEFDGTLDPLRIP